MSKDTRIEFINQQSNYLPDRKKGKRGPDPIRKEVILEELFKLFRTNCGCITLLFLQESADGILLLFPLFVF